MKAGRKGERQTERTHAWEERGRGRKGRHKRQARGTCLRMARTYERSKGGQGGGRLALENVKPTDSPIYRPPSEFAVRAFRKTFAAAARGSPTGTSASVEIGRKPRARGAGAYSASYVCASERTNDRMPHSFPSFSPFLARGAFRRQVADASREKRRGRGRGGKKARTREAGRKERGRSSGRAAGVRPISFAERETTLLTHLRGTARAACCGTAGRCPRRVRITRS